MGKIVVECTDLSDPKALQAAVDEAAGKCSIAYHNQAQAMIANGTAKSVNDAAAKIAKQTGESKESVRHRMRDGQKKVGGPRQGKSNTESDPAAAKSATAEPADVATNTAAPPSPSVKPSTVPVNNADAQRAPVEAVAQTGPVEAASASKRGGKRPGAGRPVVSKADLIMAKAVTVLDRIHPDDPQRVAALTQVVEYCQNRIERGE